jgi:hypothetical protein
MQMPPQNSPQSKSDCSVSTLKSDQIEINQDPINLLSSLRIRYGLHEGNYDKGFDNVVEKDIACKDKIINEKLVQSIENFESDLLAIHKYDVNVKSNIENCKDYHLGIDKNEDILLNNNTKLQAPDFISHLKKKPVMKNMLVGTDVAFLNAYCQSNVCADKNIAIQCSSETNNQLTMTDYFTKRSISTETYIKSVDNFTSTSDLLLFSEKYTETFQISHDSSTQTDIVTKEISTQTTYLGYDPLKVDVDIDSFDFGLVAGDDVLDMLYEKLKEYLEEMRYYLKIM